MEWEDDQQSNAFIFGVLGSSPMSDALNEIALKHKVGNKKIVVRTFNDPTNVSFCHLLFIPGETAVSFPALSQKLARGCLAVTEQRGMAALGSAINFVQVNEKLKFEVNLTTIYLAGVKASSQLLKLAIIVN